MLRALAEEDRDSGIPGSAIYTGGDDAIVGDDDDDGEHGSTTGATNDNGRGGGAADETAATPSHFHVRIIEEAYRLGRAGGRALAACALLVQVALGRGMWREVAAACARRILDAAGASAHQCAPASGESLDACDAAENVAGVIRLIACARRVSERAVTDAAARMLHYLAHYAASPVLTAGLVAMALETASVRRCGGGADAAAAADADSVRDDDVDAADGSDEDNANFDDAIAKRVLLAPLGRCLFDRATTEFALMAVASTMHASRPARRDALLGAVWEIVTDMWAHAADGGGGGAGALGDAGSGAAAGGTANGARRDAALGGTTSSFVHSASAGAAAAVVDATMALLGLARSAQHVATSTAARDSGVGGALHHAELATSNTGKLLKGVSFRLSALSRGLQQHGALVATRFFQVIEADGALARSGGDGKSAAASRQPPAPKFEQWPLLMPSYEKAATVWARVAAAHMQLRCGVASADAEGARLTVPFLAHPGPEFMSVVAGGDEPIAGTLPSAEDDDGRGPVVEHRGGSRTWLLATLRDDTFDNADEPILVAVHPALFRFAATPADGANARNTILHRVAGPAAVQRVRECTALARAAAAAAGGAARKSAASTAAAAAATTARGGHVALAASLREIETKITAGESTNTEGTDTVGPAEDAMLALPAVLERHFLVAAATTFARAGGGGRDAAPMRRVRVTDGSILARLFLLSIASTSAASSACAAAAADAAAWVLATAPSAILPECHRVLASGDFSATHKMRVFAAVQRGMARLAEVSSRGADAADVGSSDASGGLDRGARGGGVSAAELRGSDGADASEGFVVYPPMDPRRDDHRRVPEEEATAAAVGGGRGGGGNTSDGTVRWKSRKLAHPSGGAAGHGARAAAVLYRNEAVPWALAAVEAALLLPSDRWLRDGDGPLALEAIRTVALVVELVARSSIGALGRVATASVECLFELAARHYLPLVRLNALVCLGSVLRFPQTRREVLLGGGGGGGPSALGVLFVAGVAKLASADPDAHVRVVARDLLEACT